MDRNPKQKLLDSHQSSLQRLLQQSYCQHRAIPYVLATLIRNKDHCFGGCDLFIRCDADFDKYCQALDFPRHQETADQNHRSIEHFKATAIALMTEIKASESDDSSHLSSFQELLSHFYLCDMHVTAAATEKTPRISDQILHQVSEKSGIWMVIYHSTQKNTPGHSFVINNMLTESMHIGLFDTYFGYIHTPALGVPAQDAFAIALHNHFALFNEEVHPAIAEATCHHILRCVPGARAPSVIIDGTPQTDV